MKANSNKTTPAFRYGRGKEAFLQTTLKVLIVMGIFFTGIWVQSVAAHGVSIFAYVENHRILSESYFQDGRAVAGGTVEILDSNQQKVAEGVTDAEGKCVLPIPKVDDLTVVINAELGHRGTFLLKREDLEE